MLDCLLFAAARTHAVVVLPVLGGAPYDHITHEDRLIGLAKALTGHAARNGPRRGDIHVGQLLQPLPGASLSQVPPLQGCIEAGKGRMLRLPPLPSCQVGLG